MLSSYFQNLKKREEEEEEKPSCIPFIQDIFLFADHMTISNPPSPLIIKVVSACSAICKHPHTRPEVQRLSSFLYPGNNTTNRKK